MIPILKYGSFNNYIKFNEAISKVALKQYGDLRKLIHQGSYYISKVALKQYGELGKLINQGSNYIPPKPDNTNFSPFDAANDPNGLKKAMYIKAMKHDQKNG
jgi:hypothetical protein